MKRRKPEKNQELQHLILKPQTSHWYGYPKIHPAKYYRLDPRFRIRRLRGAVVQPVSPVGEKYRVKILWKDYGPRYPEGTVVVVEISDLIPLSEKYG